MQSDCQIFLAAFRALGGVDNTLTESNCCTWKPDNVVCRDSNIYQISLSDSIIQTKGSRIPFGFTKLSLLQTLELTNMGLVGDIPPFNQSFSGFILQGNQLNGTIPNINFLFGIPQLGLPYFDLKNNYFGGDNIPPLLAAQQFRDCPFDRNMCSNFNVQSCPNVTFTCSPNIIVDPTPTSTPNSSTTSPTLVYIILGGICGFVVLCIIGIYHWYRYRQVLVEQRTRISTPSRQSKLIVPSDMNSLGRHNSVKTSGSLDRTRSVTSDVAALERTNLCMNCATEPIQYRVLPCTHETLCMKCAKLNPHHGVDLCLSEYTKVSLIEKAE
ncbi:hypothetical protein HDV06_004820 [Boothiomyces sp. JEL0866]|nr:hypothetical protein HDV06_004820 [Boothiomyces sp. JEL0866]